MEASLSVAGTSTAMVVGHGSHTDLVPLDTLAAKFSLTTTQREDVRFFLVEYKTNLLAVEKMLNWGLNTSEISELLQVREALKSSDDSVSLNALHNFVEAFSMLSYDMEVLGDVIESVSRIYPTTYISQALSRIIEVSQELGILDPIHCATVLARRGY